MADTPYPLVYSKKVATPTSASRSTPVTTPIELPAVIWTPRFLVIFTLTLVVSLSVTSLLAVVQSNTAYSTDRVVLLYALVALACWIMVLIRARMPWIRLGALFCVAWAVLEAGGAIFGLLGIETRAVVFIHLHAATNSALLGACICLTSAYTLESRWDAWFFRLAPLLSIGFSAWLFLPSLGKNQPLFGLERAITTVLLYLSLFSCWLRPSSWKVQPGPGFLLGAIPLIQLILNASHDAPPTMQYFFSLVMLLCMLLTGMRILQGELQQKRRLTSTAPLHSQEN